MYRVRDAAQREYGPVTGEVVRQWLTEGRLNSQTSIKLEGTDEWKPLGTFEEFKDALRVSAPPPLPTGVSPGPPGPRTGLAITSLILGILSLFCLGPITGIAAIITGAMALSRSRKAPAVYGGSGMALAGLITGSVGTILTLLILPGLLLPALAQAKARAQSIKCVTQLKQIGLGAKMYAIDHDERFPPDFLNMSNELADPKLLVCPADTSKSPATVWGNVGAENVSYEFLAPGIAQEGAEEKEILRCPVHGHTGYGDGTVQQRSLNRR